MEIILNGIKYLIQPKFSWFETIGIILAAMLYPISEVSSFLLTVLTGYINILLKERFS